VSKETYLGRVLEIKSEISKFWSRKRAQKIKENKEIKISQKNPKRQLFENWGTAKIVIRKLGYRKDGYSKACVQRKMLVFPKKM
jgi:hypothetical protein